MSNQVRVVLDNVDSPSIVKIISPGPQGPPGEPGPSGAPGVGSAWQQASGVPASGIGSNGDYYLDTSNGNIYGPKANDAWGNVIFNIAEGQNGADGREVELQAASGYIQWKYEDDPSWTNLISLAAITGPAGTAGVVAANAPATYDSNTQTIGVSVGTASGTVAAGNDSRFSELASRLDAFRDAATFYVSKRATASNSNNGTSEGEPLATIEAAVAAANAYVTANPGNKAKINVGPGVFVEQSLPFRLKPGVLAHGALQRGTTIKPAAGQELNGFWALDSGCMVADFTFAGHQASGTSTTDSTVGTRAWAVRLNEQANGNQGVILAASPYVMNCASITAEDDDGAAGSTSVGDTGGGVLVDGNACHPDSPVRSMVVYGFTQQNLGGPGCVVRNDAYAELVSFFGLFGTWHVQCETGGQATLSGGGCSEFGLYGLVADGYSGSALYTGSLRTGASAGATSVDVVSMTSNRLGNSSRPASGQIMLLASSAYVVQSAVPIDASGNIVADDAPTRAGYRVVFYSPDGVGLTGNVSQGATADFRQRSQISAGCHSANYVGAGTNYLALPWNGGVPVRGNEAVERNLGRVFGLIVNDVGDVKIAGGAFAVDGTTGAVTINTDEFNLSGLNAIGPFSRNGGVSTVGVQLQEVSNNATLLASTGSSDGNTAPTQFAVRTYVDDRFLTDVTADAGPLSVSDTSTQDGNGFWTRSRNLELSTNVASGLVQLDGSGKLPAVDGSQLTGLPPGGVTSIALTVPTGLTVSGSPITTSGSFVVSYASGYSLPTISGQANWDTAYSERLRWDGSSTGLNAATARTSLELGTAATTDATAYATAAQGALADTAVQPATLSGYVTTSDGRLTDSREWSAATIDQAEAEAGTAITRRAFTAQRVFQAIAAWWNGSAAKAKLDTVASGATANSSDATLLARANHTGTQTASTISDFSSAASAAAPVQSVAGKTGAVTLAAGDVSGVATSGAIGNSGLTMATARILARSSAGAGAIEEHTLPTGFDLSGGALRAPAEIGVACSDETSALTAGTAKLTFRMPYAMTLTAVRLSVTTAPTGSALVVNIKEGGVSIFSTKPQIDAGSTTSVGSGTAAVISDSALADNAVITVDIDQIGSTVAGAGLKVWLIGRRA